MNYYVRPATEADAYTFADKLREEDKAEIKAASGWSPVKAILSGLDGSGKVYSAWTEDHQPICIFGVNKHPAVAEIGIPWMVGTPLIQQYFVPFLRDGKKKLMPFVTGGFNLLINWVDSRNTVHIKWLTWMGFQIDKENPVYLNDPEVPFYPFTYSSEDNPYV